MTNSEIESWKSFTFITPSIRFWNPPRIRFCECCGASAYYWPRMDMHLSNQCSALDDKDKRYEPV